jgi:hypothetical protein
MLRLNLAASCFLLSSACLANNIVGSGDPATEGREVGAFDAVSIEDALVAEIMVASDRAHTLSIQGDDNLVSVVRARVEEGRLILDLPPHTAIQPTLPLLVKVAAPHMRAVDASDASRVHVNQLVGNELAVQSRDASKVEVGAARAGSRLAVAASDASAIVVRSIEGTGSVAVEVDDGSDVLLQGAAATLEARVRDASTLDAAALSAGTVALRAGDAASASVCANDALDVDVADGSDATYYCEPPHVVQQVRDGSALHRR